MTRLELWTSAALGAASLVCVRRCTRNRKRAHRIVGRCDSRRPGSSAQSVPEATLYLKLAQEQREQALQLVNRGDNHSAAMLLTRAEATPELAVALARRRARTGRGPEGRGERPGPRAKRPTNERAPLARGFPCLRS